MFQIKCVHELANNRTFTVIPRQQTNRIQGNNATHLHIRDRAMGMQQAIQHQDPPNIPVKNAQNDQQCPPGTSPTKPCTVTSISRT